MTTVLVFCVPFAALLVALFSKEPATLTSSADSRKQKGA
ncbi:MAG: hypothetical protein CBARDMAM_6602 [uncultured Caballeronia sp.]|nr:MAG: hypothetical protein CBARDMAM_6602 [uncultured Caballeronia sp.]